MPTIEALDKSFPGSIPGLFSHFFRINFVKFLYIVQTDTELMLTVQKLRPEWGKEQSVQDGQVTILDLPRDFQEHMAYHIWKFTPSKPIILISNLQISKGDGNFQPHSLQKGLAREYYSHGLEYFLGPYQ